MDLMTKLSTNAGSAPSTATSGPLQEMFVLEHPKANASQNKKPTKKEKKRE
jgi:hypothetical protein